jgi:hypothetical protein
MRTSQKELQTLKEYKNRGSGDGLLESGAVLLEVEGWKRKTEDGGQRSDVENRRAEARGRKMKI